ncbi:unnamed protein product [Merluccius merluccius]
MAVTPISTSHPSAPRLLFPLPLYPPRPPADPPCVGLQESLGPPYAGSPLRTRDDTVSGSLLSQPKCHSGRLTFSQDVGRDPHIAWLGFEVEFGLDWLELAGSRQIDQTL